MKSRLAIYLLIKNCRRSRVRNWRNIPILLALLILGSVEGKCQSEDTYDEITVVMNVQRIGSIEIPAMIHNQEAYLPIKDIFDFLRIKNTLSADYDLVTGYFINPQARFSIDKTNKTIVYDGKTTTLDPTDLIQTENNLYLKSSYFGQVFGLVCTFNFRDLSVTLTTKIELPVIREMQQELMRRNISRIRGEKKADTTIKRSFPMFHLGMADWSVVSAQQTQLGSNTRINLALGAVLAGGEANMYLNYTSGQPLTMKQQYYNWHFVNNNNSLLRQVTAGKIFTQSNASIFAPITGVQFSNTPTTYRRTFGTYTLSNKTEPGWIVELYINNVMVNFMKADASGFYSFEVPMVYGNSVVKLRFYGPWGEEHSSEQYINIPFNFMPLQQFEYTVTAGIVEDDKKSRFTRVNLNYGLSRRLTIGGGMEYLSSLATGKLMPYLTASMRLGSKLLLSGERTHGVRTVGIISYRTPSNFQADFNYTKYDIGQTAIKYNYLEEKKATFSMPFRGTKFSAFTRLTIDEVTLVKSKFTSAEMLLSAVVARVSANLTTYAVITDRNPLVYSNLATSFHLPAGIRFTPQVQYEYRRKNFSMLRADIEKTISNKGFLNLTYEKNFVTNIQSMAIGLRYNFSFAQTFFNVHQGNGMTTMMQSARGSLLYDNSTGYFGTNNQNNVGRGGVILVPFLDLNCNGKREENEPAVTGLNLRSNGGRIEHNNRDTTIRIVGLEAYNDYIIELDKNSFDNVAWQIRKPKIQVAIDPNNFKRIEVPVAVVGEVSGSILVTGEKEMSGLGRMIVNIYDQNSILVARTLTEADGFFSYAGLSPGNYTATVDAAQLTKLRMVVASSSNGSFTIKPGIEGDVQDGLQFVLKKKEGLNQ